MTEEAPKRHRTSDCAPARYGNWCCQRHYRRWRKTGSTEPPSRPSLSERFWAKVEKQQEGCWIWTATTRNGYGSITSQDGTRYAHRLSYEWHCGVIPAGLVVRHRCDNPLCVRPDHLELGTKAENSRDMVERGRSPRNQRAQNTHCPQGHPFDEENTYWWNGARQCKACKAEDCRARRGTGAATSSKRMAGQARSAYRPDVDRDWGGEYDDPSDHYYC